MTQQIKIASVRRAPSACFDTLKNIDDWPEPPYLNNEQRRDYDITVTFLSNYVGSVGTFNAYRRELERLLHWTWGIAKKTLSDLGRKDIEEFVKFCGKPPQAWIGTSKPPRFEVKDGKRIPNAEWRPFVVTVSKADFKKGIIPDKKNFVFSEAAVKELFAILNSFFNYLLQEEYAHRNPVSLIRQKSKFISKKKPKIRRLSAAQWQAVIETAECMADQDPVKHERTLFIMSALYSLYLRISELAADQRWAPTMNDFRQDEGLWWFTTVGKGNKERDIAVSDSMLRALKRWRKFLKLSALPSPSDETPLIPKIKGHGPLSNATHIREIVQCCFDQAIERLRHQGDSDEAEILEEATVHWLRHTGISDDVKIRPREHVRDDAGHSSSVTTDKYIDIELKERHRSAKRKQIKEA